jgi:hypothetical protein
MNKLIRTGLLVAALAGLGTGCASIGTSMASSTSATGEAWYVENVGFAIFASASRVFYCPAVTAPGPAECKEAKMVPLTPAQIAAQQPPK